MPDSNAHDAPELIPRLTYSKTWEDPADYATRQNNEIQNRKDLQSLFTEIATYINNVMLPRAEQLLTENGGGGTGAGGVSGDFLPLDGGTMRGPLRLYRDPVLNAESATKQYVDGVAGDVVTDFNGSLTAIRQTADEIELLAQSHDSEIASFEPVNGIYSPIDRYGAGNHKAWILKSADGFDIRYLTPGNQEIGIRMGADGKVRIDGFAYDIDAIRAAMGMAVSGVAGENGSGTGASSGSGTGASGAGNDGSGTGASRTGVGFDLTQINADGTTSALTVDADGYADVSGMRKVTALDFSRIDGGIFSETLDGGILNTYQIERDGSGRIRSVTDATGHETVVTW